MRLFPSTVRIIAALAALLLLGGVLSACGSGDDDDDGSTPVATATGPTPTRGVLSPPLEGPRPTYVSGERKNYRELPEWALPAPEDLPEPPDDAEGAEFETPETPVCPEGWTVYARTVEGFRMCWPPAGWLIDGEGYVTVANQDRWYSAGFFYFRDGVQVAHVSVYAMQPSVPPYTFTKDCAQAYRVTFGGAPGVLCPDFPGVSPEARIIAYHARTDAFDYFVNVVPYFTYDPATGTYSDSVDSEVLAEAIQIAHSFELTPPFAQ